jgi:hypothetical protein
MCATHWRLVPRTLQHEVREAWDVRLRDNNEENAQSHNQAKAKAIQAVRQKLGR